MIDYTGGSSGEPLHASPSGVAMSKKKIRVLVADDHELVRSGIVSMLAGTEMEVVAGAASGEEAVKLTARHTPDVVLLDIRMANGDGLAALSRIKAEHPGLPVLILSTYDNPTYISRAVSLGAVGYLLKGASREEIVAGIRKAASGESAWSREELRRVTGALATPRLAADV